MRWGGEQGGLGESIMTHGWEGVHILIWAGVKIGARFRSKGVIDMGA